MLPLPLIANGKGFIRALENAGALAVYAPLEGGYEGRYQRRLRAHGYSSISLSARGLGDVGAYLMEVHGVRPAHLGKKNIAQEGAVGPIYFAQPMAGYQLDNLPPQSKGLVLWVLEGYILSQTEIQDLISLTKREPRLKIILEMGGDRVFRWQPLLDCLRAA
ncbi:MULTISPECIES: NAD(P)H-quinone oxidoreductase subunit N [unclassified Synechocystis]|uniref:NAD(P)H-quinone oxidoreductase subunit N n=1 Tax=unclassified Synechocystis TaxID=2640012 RepID=UPI0004D15A0E|nr:MULTISPECIES: NAD(P)H-quinone oxidoreductase subunit N [unclassified Synechocystis]AIE74752.1 Putative subunit of NAD(P)H:quinone oxidoreductase [Synechocystis sp. PCC 6714]MCT0253902.1 NAD(P)H-quinone oxidoreductase subunit N [Synechocystis sp. CS-94]